MNTLRELLQGKLAEEDIALVPAAFDMVGSILIFNEFPDMSKKKEKIVGKTLLEQHAFLTGVFKKIGEYGGPYRTPKLACIAGDPSTETEYREHNCRIVLDVQKVYFSARLSTERKRIYQLVQPGEKVLVMFSGCGIYPVVIAKNTGAEHVWGVEINPAGHHYAEKNKVLNKVPEKITNIEGDVREKVPAIKETFHRILMPLPKDADSFLDVALDKIKEQSTIHMYTFGQEDEIDTISKKIISLGKKNGKKIKIVHVEKCGQFSPGVFRLCFDFAVASARG